MLKKQTIFLFPSANRPTEILFFSSLFNSYESTGTNCFFLRFLFFTFPHQIWGKWVSKDIGNLECKLFPYYAVKYRSLNWWWASPLLPNDKWAIDTIDWPVSVFGLWDLKFVFLLIGTNRFWYKSLFLSYYTEKALEN